MKNCFFLIYACLLIAACSNSKDEQQEVEEVETGTEILLWQSDLDDSTGRLELIHDKPMVVDTLTPETIITYLNNQYPRVQLKLDRISRDTLYVSIPEADFLTQQMGSSGPIIYFADAVYNLTEIPGMRYINFNFEEGDHAAPSVESRESIIKEFQPTIKDSLAGRIQP